MFLKVLFIALLLLGLFFTLFGVYFIALGNEARSWPEAPGTIVSVRKALASGNTEPLDLP